MNRVITTTNRVTITSRSFSGSSIFMPNSV